MRPRLKYFKIEEFDSPATQAEIDDSSIKTYKRGSKHYLKDSAKHAMDPVFLDRVDTAREYVEKEWNDNKPKSERIVFKINSGFRTRAYNNTLKNSVKNSSHLNGHAVDLAWGNYTLEQKKFIAKALYLAGFRRFGPANTFIHTDDDVNKPQFANWGYPVPLFDVFSLVA